MKVLEFIYGFIVMLLLTGCFVGCSFMGAAIEQEIRCKNGAAMYCLE